MWLLARVVGVADAALGGPPRPGDVQPDPLGGRRRPPVTPADPDRGRQLFSDGLDSSSHGCRGGRRPSSTIGRPRMT
jgi:hypothetical protein